MGKTKNRETLRDQIKELANKIELTGKAEVSFHEYETGSLFLLVKPDGTTKLSEIIPFYWNIFSTEEGDEWELTELNNLLNEYLKQPIPTT